MSQQPLGPGWWQASDGRWYPPDQWTGPPGTSPPTAVREDAAATAQTARTPAASAEPGSAGGATEAGVAAAPQLAQATSARRYCGSLVAALPEGWVAQEKLTMLAPDGRANVIASSERVEATMDSARFGEQQRHSLSQVPGYEEHSFDEVTVFGDRSARLRLFSWTPPDGGTVVQLQLTFSEHGYSVMATATTPRTEWDRYGGLLREALLSLSLPLGAGWWQASDLRWYPPERWTGPPGTIPASVPGAAGSGMQAGQCATTLSAVLPPGWFSKEQLTLRAPDGQANVIYSTEPLDPAMDSRRYAESQGELLARECPQYQELSFDAVMIFGDRTGFLRRFTWTPEEGVPVYQMQTYFVLRARGFTATATTPATAEVRYDPVLRTVLSDLRIRTRSSA